MEPPARCTCTTDTAPTLAATLACPLPWWPVPDVGWGHLPGRVLAKLAGRPRIR